LIGIKPPFDSFVDIVDIVDNLFKNHLLIVLSVLVKILVNITFEEKIRTSLPESFAFGRGQCQDC